MNDEQEMQVSEATATGPGFFTKPAEAEPKAAAPEFRLIEVGLIEPSKTNPRKTFGKEGLKELAESLKSAGGVIEPLVVRPHPASPPGWWEIIAGERRWRAAKIAGLKTVPCMVRELDDLEVLKIQIIENLQREDLSPLEEGAGYRLWIDKTGLSAEAIGEEIGKSRRTIFMRMALCDLIPSAKKLLLEGKISASHAEFVGRLSSPADQERLVRERLKPDWNGHYPSVRELARIIGEEYYHLLDAASFPKADANLYPVAGACTVCPKNTAVNPDLGGDKKGGTCTDGTCFRAKTEAFLARLEEEAGKDVIRLSSDYQKAPAGSQWIPADEWKECKPGDCEFAAPGLIVHGRQRLGAKLTVCIQKSCKKHHASGLETDERWKQQMAAERRKAEIEIKARQQYWLKLREVLPETPDEIDWQFMARAVVRQIGHDAGTAACRALGLALVKRQYSSGDYEKPLVDYAKKAGKGIGRFVLLLLSSGGLVGGDMGGAAMLTDLGARRKLDLKKMREMVLAEQKDKEHVKDRRAKKAAPAKAEKVQSPAPKKASTKARAKGKK